MSYLTTPTSFITVDGTQIAYRGSLAGMRRTMSLGVPDARSAFRRYSSSLMYTSSW